MKEPDTPSTQPCQCCGSRESKRFCTACDRILPVSGIRWQIRRCVRCGHAWTHPPLAPESIAGYYPEKYGADASRTADEFIAGTLQASRSWRDQTEKVRLIERYVNRGRILDVGCGDARFLLALNASVWQRTGVDLARTSLDVMRERFPALRLICGGIEALEDSGFDVVTFWHVLEHLPDPESVLRRAAQLLRPGGWIFVSAPNVDSLQAALFRQHWYCFDDVPRHLHHFSPRSLEHFLKKAGMKIRSRAFFSRRVSFHSLKHSLVHWSEDTFGTRAPYYLLRPLLYCFVAAEFATRRYGISTAIAQK